MDHELTFAPREQVSGLTIDAATSKDLDDALWIEPAADGCRVLVSITDVAAHVPVGSDIYQVAQERVATQYRRHHNHPMLPRALAEESLSLLAHQPRQTLTFDLHLTPTLAVQSLTIQETYLESHRRLSYAEVDDILANQPDDADYAMLSLAYNLAEGLLHQRQQQGALAVYDLETRLFTDEEGQLQRLSQSRAYKAYLIIRELMILTNRIVAQQLAQANIPCLFRNHTIRATTPDRQEILNQFQAALVNPGLLTNLAQRINLWFAPATYDPVLKGHFGLNEVAYTHVTSPIRRFPDLVNQHIIKAYLADRPSPYSQDELQALAEAINDHLTAEKTATSDYMRQQAAEKGVYQAQYVTAKKLVAMSNKEFDRVIKEACRQKVLSSDLVQAITTRLEQGTITSGHLAVLFFETMGRSGTWQRIREAALTYAQQEVGMSNQVLHLHAAQMGTLTDIAVETETTAQGFAARVLAVVEGQVMSTPQYALGPNTQLAQHQASYEFLVAYLAGTLVPAAQSEMPPAAESLLAEPPVSTVSDNFIGRLHEFCQIRADWGPPIFKSQQTGPSHAPIITSQVQLPSPMGLFTATAQAANKKAARQLAAQKLLQEIETLEIPDPEPAPSQQTENFVGQLNTFCQQTKRPLPTYTFQQSDKGFVCTVTLQLEEEVSKTFSATGLSKKAAKQEAAQGLWQAVNE